MDNRPGCLHPLRCAFWWSSPESSARPSLRCWSRPSSPSN